MHHVRNFYASLKHSDFSVLAHDILSRLSKLEYREKMLSDDRLFYFSPIVSSDGKHSRASRALKKSKVYNNTCAFCGTNVNVTHAHLVASNHALTYDEFSTARGYNTDLDVLSPRNFLPLCGTLGVKETCHDAFDKYRMTLVYSAQRRVYTIYCLDLKRAPQRIANLHLKDIIVDDNFPPYRRLLAWRTRKCLVEHRSGESDKGEALFDLANFSDVSRGAGADAGAGGSSEGASEGVSEGASEGAMEGTSDGGSEGASECASEGV